MSILKTLFGGAKKQGPQYIMRVSSELDDTVRYFDPTNRKFVDDPNQIITLLAKDDALRGAGMFESEGRRYLAQIQTKADAIQEYTDRRRRQEFLQKDSDRFIDSLKRKNDGLSSPNVPPPAASRPAMAPRPSAPKPPVAQQAAREHVEDAVTRVEYVVRLKFGNDFKYFDPTTMKLVSHPKNLTSLFRQERDAKQILAAAQLDGQIITLEQAVREHESQANPPTSTPPIKSPASAQLPPESNPREAQRRSAQTSNVIEEAKDMVRNSRGARDFLARATQAGWIKIKEDFIGIYLRKEDATLIFGVLPSRGPDTIWNAMMSTKSTGTVQLINEGKIVV